MNNNNLNDLLYPTGGKPKLTRKQRRAKDRESKQLKDSRSEVQQALDITHSIAKMVKAGAMKTDFDSFSLHINEEMFWKERTREHHQNFSRSMLTYFNMNQGLVDEYEHDELDIYSIDTGKKLATYTKEFGLEYSN